MNFEKKIGFDLIEGVTVSTEAVYGIKLNQNRDHDITFMVSKDQAIDLANVIYQKALGETTRRETLKLNTWSVDEKAPETLKLSCEGRDLILTSRDQHNDTTTLIISETIQLEQIAEFLIRERNRQRRIRR